jgi:hypothetical protein
MFHPRLSYIEKQKLNHCGYVARGFLHCRQSIPDLGIRGQAQAKKVRWMNGIMRNGGMESSVFAVIMANARI